MKRILLVNSAMMPQPGLYSMSSITRREFINEVIRAHDNHQLESYIGYRQNAELIYKWTGIQVAVNRSETRINEGDTMLVMKLKYRPSSDSKGRHVREDDFEFYIVSVLATYETKHERGK